MPGMMFMSDKAARNLPETPPESSLPLPASSVRAEFHTWDRDPWYDEIWLDRFWSRIDQSGGPDSCWPWTGGTNADGYGGMKRRGKAQLTHRVACELKHGPPPAGKPMACHSLRCTTRACCNPAHLRWDTNAGNQNDAATLGSRKGEKHGMAGLAPAQVVEVWRRRNERPCDVARALGISQYAARLIMVGRTWRHITGAPAPAPSSPGPASAPPVGVGPGPGLAVAS